MYNILIMCQTTIYILLVKVEYTYYESNYNILMSQSMIYLIKSQSRI